MSVDPDFGSAADIAGPEHWENVWRNVRSAAGVSRFNYYNFRLLELFRPQVKMGSRVLEVGCGASRWVPYFEQSLRCESWGIDYSPEGINLVARALPPGSKCQLVEADFFDPAALPTNYFELIYSFGFIEHFSHPVAVTRRFAELLAPGGKVLTLVPNFKGIYGYFQEAVDEELFHKHVVMDCADLDNLHDAAGLSPMMPAKFSGCFGPGVVSLFRLNGKHIKLGQWIAQSVRLLQQLTCWTLRGVRCDFESQTASPWIVGIYENNNSKDSATDR